MSSMASRTESEEDYAPFNFSWLVENKIAGMGWPQSVANLNYLVKIGINHLITLSPERVPPILECKGNLKWTEIPIKEFGAPTLKQMLKFIGICERATMRGEVIGVHCRQGRGRTGTMLACYLVHAKGMAPERAVLTVRVLRPGSCETYEQEKAVCHFHDCLRGTVTNIDYILVDNKKAFDMVFPKEPSPEPPKIEEAPAKEKSAEPEEKPKKRKKSTAMVINHKIYF